MEGIQEQNGDDMQEPPIIPVPLSARVIYGMSLGVLPVWQMSASLKDVYSSKVEIAIKATLLITVCGFFGCSAMLLFPNLGDSHIVAISIVSIFVLGMMVVLGSSLRRFVKIRTGDALITPRQIRYI